MSTATSNKEPKVNTFISSAAVIKFSGGSVGTEQWTDSEDEEDTPHSRTSPDSQKPPLRSSKEDNGARTVGTMDTMEKGYRERTKEAGVHRDVIANGNVNHKRSGNSIQPRVSHSQRNTDRILTQGDSDSNLPFRSQRGNTTDLQSGTSKKKTMEENLLPESPFPEVDGFEVVPRRKGSYEESHNPFSDVPCDDEDKHIHNDHHNVGSRNHSFDEKHGHSYSFESDLDISLPSEDQDLAEITNEDLGVGLTENHFSQPEGIFGFSRIEELEMAIGNCKEEVKTSLENSENRRKMVAKLVQLRLKLLQLQEGDEEEEKEEVKVVLGHRFYRMKGNSRNDHCEVCLSVIWTLLQTWFKCSECNFGCHGKCLNLVKRKCVSAKISRPCFDLNICPEKGLSAQKYRCAECRAPLAFNGVPTEPRLCDYSGLYYCSMCHWNDQEVIPARVIHNWDFEPRRVCRQSKQLLKLMCSKAVLRIQDLNPLLFNYVEELSQIKKLRGEILTMKVYFLSCRRAMEQKLLKQLQVRPHFVENSDSYSLQDLIDTEEGNLLTELATLHGDYAVHIRIDCQICQGKGFICEICHSNEILFPFDMIATLCATCSAVFHRDCFYKWSGDCPKCTRLSQRASADRPASSPARPIQK
ncbi:differentially expressed in FDCP 8 homolog [Strongylocentrotus purpuratus]|uniref:Differentially expressed in FDCP 8 homolog n=1 Tax=Strongylocentrotus purpuratus TaxID=7668 RepID=A0A7M7NRM0_STRPU|nr:differentially expressed in FDCP 8 homolog [Strongylocentrotus purpuratus]XP_030840670.1 differentially expressed in FDCP 8 homolog [Strongylocentrotus purpuratus]XP_030840679.1 differentially expressed in FDCP 8 homolog [Strongylocentrotus purpuratus]